MILDSLSVITNQWRGVFGILLFVALGQTLISSALKNIFGKQLTPNEYLSLGMAGWLLPVSLLSLLWFLFGFEPSSPFSLFLLISLISIPIFFLLRLRPKLDPDSKPTAFSLLLFFSISVLLRLVFVSKAILPLYFDSAQHYMLIKHITGHTTGLITSLTTSYYHLGYHILTAFVVSTFQVEITRTMLILGQMILAVLPLSVFFLIKHETKSNVAGVFAVLISAFGWYMPAHAVDWGKYPALLSLGLMPFGLSLAYLLSQNKNILLPRRRRAFSLLLGVGILVIGLFHSRSPVIIGIAFLAWVIATWRQRLPRVQRAFMFSLAIVAIILESIFIQNNEVLLLLFDPYVHKGVLITALVLFLAIFGQRAYPQFTFACILTVCFLLSSLFIPVMGLIPGHENLTLLDRPFVEMILFLPLSLLGGLGLAGLLESLRGWQSPAALAPGAHLLRAQVPGSAGGQSPKWLEDFRRGWGLLRPRQANDDEPRYYSLLSLNGLLLAIGLILINVFAAYDLYPSECCVIAGNDDVVAMDWMNNQLPMDARIGISATELKVMASESFEGYVGGDAGIWITPLIDRVTIPLIYDSNFDEQVTLDTLCQMSISHLYVGELGQTFNNLQLNAQPAWYKVLLSMPKVQVYEVVGCD